MIIRPEEWWSGDRFKARIFSEVRQVIFDIKSAAYQAAPRRKTEITYEVAEAIVGAAAVAIGWRDDPANWKAAADELRRLADEMEKTGLRDKSWGPNATFNPSPVTYRAAIFEDEGYVYLRFPDLPELEITTNPREDVNVLAQNALDEVVLTRLVGGEDLPQSPKATAGEVDVTVGPVAANKLLVFWLYGRRPKSR